MKQLCFALLFSACIPKERVVPAVAPNAAAPHGQAGPLKVWANTVLPQGTPSDTEAWLLPVGIDIQNDGDTPVDFNLDDVRLSDDLGNKTAPFFFPMFQTTPVDPDALRKSVRANPPATGSLTGDSTAVFMREGGRAGPAGAGAWIDFTGVPTSPPIAWKEEVRFVGGPKSLSTRSLTDRVIPAKQKAFGFLFFPRSKSGAKKLTLEWKGAKVSFDVVTLQ